MKMKRLLLMILILSVSALTVDATDIWTGSQDITWESTLDIDADQFSSVEVGDLLIFDLTFSEVDVIELKSAGERLPGTLYTQRGTDYTRHEVYVTAPMLALLQESGLEVCGNHFTLTKVSYADGKGYVHDGAIWTGYFWIDSWNTMELWPQALPDDWSDYKEMIIYHEANRTDYVINIRANWEDAGIISNGGSHLTKYDTYAVLDLSEVDIASVMTTTSSDRLMIQGNKEEGAAFNMTEIVLVKNTYNRAVTADKYGTICLPYASSAVTGAEFYRILGKEVDGSSNLTNLWFEQVNTLEAGVPYLFKATASELTVTYTGDVVIAPDNSSSNGLIGAYAQAQIPQEESNYILYNNELYQVGTNDYNVGANRAYFNTSSMSVYDPNSASAPGRKRVSLSTNSQNTATAIDAHEADNTGIWYDMLGRPVALPLSGGVYISSGRKMIIKP